MKLVASAFAFDTGIAVLLSRRGVRRCGLLHVICDSFIQLIHTMQREVNDVLEDKSFNSIDKIE